MSRPGRPGRLVAKGFCEFEPDLCRPWREPGSDPVEVTKRAHWIWAGLGLKVFRGPNPLASTGRRLLLSLIIAFAITFVFLPVQ